MEIPVISRISGFETGIHSLQNPSMVSRIFHLSGLEETSQIYSIWTWSALILTVIATFSSVIARTKLVIFRLWKRSSRSIDKESLLRPLVDDDEDDDCCSSSSSDDEDQGTFENQRHVDEDSRVAGSDRRRRCIEDRFSWSDFASGKNVVKLWDGLGLGFEDSSRSLDSMWDLNRGKEFGSLLLRGRCQIPAVSMLSPAVLISAELEHGLTAALRIWDTRIGRQIPAALAEWQPRNSRKIVGIDSGGVEKVYVMDDACSLAVRDMRNVKLPLEVLTESDGNTWWDADAVISSDGDDDDGCFLF